MAQTTPADYQPDDVELVEHCEVSLAALQAQMAQAIRDEEFALAAELKPQVQAETERQARLREELDAVLAKMPPVRVLCLCTHWNRLVQATAVKAAAL